MLYKRKIEYPTWAGIQMCTGNAKITDCLLIIAKNLIAPSVAGVAVKKQISFFMS